MADKKVVKTFISTVRSIDEENFVVEAVASDETIDRYKEKVLADAYKKTLKNFRKHAVLLAGHDYYNITSQIGEWEKLWIENGQLVGKAKYYVGLGNPQADWAWQLAKKGIAAYSVGFVPIQYEDISYEEYEKSGGKKPWRTYTEVELLEISHVLVPANPSALQRSFGAEEFAEEFLVKKINEDTDLTEILNKTFDTVYDVVSSTIEIENKDIADFVIEDIKPLTIEDPIGSIGYKGESGPLGPTGPIVTPEIKSIGTTEEEMDKILKMLEDLVTANERLSEEISAIDQKMLDITEKIDNIVDNKIETPVVADSTVPDEEYIGKLFEELEAITKSKAKELLSV